MTIPVQNTSEVNAKGKQRNANAKPVFCIDTGEVYASMLDAAEAVGVNPTAISWVITGKSKTCKGKRYCLISKIAEHIDEIAECVRIRETKVNAYNEIMFRQQAQQRATENYEKHKAACEKLAEKLENEKSLLAKAEAELSNLQLKEAV